MCAGCWSWRAVRHHVADLAPRVDDARTPGGVELGAEDGDRDVDRVAHDLRAVVVDMLLKLGAGNGPAGAVGEIFQHRVLARRELDHPGRLADDACGPAG